LGVDKATISRAIYSLIDKNYLKKRKSPADGRVNLIYLTEKAEAGLCQKIYEKVMLKTEFSF
jgi:DNA-binding MarR family transcriptional regulator